MEKENGTALMSESLINEVMGEMEYTLSQSELDGRDSYSIAVRQTTPDGKEFSSVACDVTDDEERATALFRMIAEGEVEPCVLYDILYDLLP